MVAISSAFTMDSARLQRLEESPKAYIIILINCWSLMSDLRGKWVGTISVGLKFATAVRNSTFVKGSEV